MLILILVLTGDWCGTHPANFFAPQPLVCRAISPYWTLTAKCLPCWGQHQHCEDNSDHHEDLTGMIREESRPRDDPWLSLMTVMPL